MGGQRKQERLGGQVEQRKRWGCGLSSSDADPGIEWLGAVRSERRAASRARGSAVQAQAAQIQASGLRVATDEANPGRGRGRGRGGGGRVRSRGSRGRRLARGRHGSGGGGASQEKGSGERAMAILR